MEKHKPVGKMDNPASRTPTILIAEDNEINMMLIQGTIRKLLPEVEIIGASDGRKALEAFSGSDRIDFVLMDIQMPGMSGLEATRAIRLKEKDSGRHVPVVALTASALAEDRDRCMEAGMNDFLSKPFEPEKLRELFEKYLGLKGFQQQQKPDGGTDKAVFDAKQLLDRAGDETLAMEVLGSFLKSLSDRLATIKGAMESGDRHLVRTVAHTIKGSSANIGCGLLSAAASDLEKEARGAGEIVQLKRLLDQLDSQARIAAESIEKHLAR